MTWLVIVCSPCAFVSAGYPQRTLASMHYFYVTTLARRNYGRDS